jgi:probable F420-dependent oxidoreductase
MQLGVALGNLGFAMSEPMEPVAHAALSLRLGREAERLGFHSVWVGDHLALPLEASTPYPYGGSRVTLNPNTAMLDPFAVLAAIAAQTSRVRLGFGVVVLPFRHPLVTAKLVSTIDAISAGRVILGVGTGWMPEEFAALGVEFEERGAATDDGLRYLVEVFSSGRIDGMTVLPSTVQRPRPPIWVGGNGLRAMRWAVALADGWDAPYADPQMVADGIARLRPLCESAGRDPASVGVSVRGVPAATVDGPLIDAYERIGVTQLGVMLPVGDPPRAFDDLEALARRCPQHVE